MSTKNGKTEKRLINLKIMIYSSYPITKVVGKRGLHSGVMKGINHGPPTGAARPEGNGLFLKRAE